MSAEASQQPDGLPRPRTAEVLLLRARTTRRRDRARARAGRAQQARWEGIIARFSNRPELAARVRSAELGTRLARTAAAFWEEVIERQTQADAT